MRGVLVLGQEIEIRPGVTVRDDANNSQVFPTKSKIMSLKSDKNDLQVNHFPQHKHSPQLVRRSWRSYRCWNEVRSILV